VQREPTSEIKGVQHENTGTDFYLNSGYFRVRGRARGRRIKVTETALSVAPAAPNLADATKKRCGS
jgi:hypothetical protein